MLLDFEKNLSLILARSVVYFTKEELSPNGIVDDARNNEGNPPNTGDIANASLGQFNHNLPKVLQTTGSGVNSYNQSVAPAQQALQAKLFAQFAPILNQIGQQMATSNAQSQSSSDASILNGTGKQVVSGAAALQHQLDPNFYNIGDQVTSGVTRLLSGLGNPNELSGSESANIERGINRGNYNSGNAFNGNPLTTIQNAMTFGQGLQQRQGFNMGMQQAASGIAPQLKSGMDAFQMTTGKPSIPQFGSNQLTGTQQSSDQASQGANGLMSNLFGASNNWAQLQQAHNQNNSVQGIMSSLPSYS